MQKFSRKGWLCKTWEGEMALVTMPGAIPEKFLFTVWDDKVAEQINHVVGKRVTLHYEEKVGLPTTCFGETRHFVSTVVAFDENPLAPSSAAAGVTGDNTARGRGVRARSGRAQAHAVAAVRVHATGAGRAGGRARVAPRNQVDPLRTMCG